MKKDYDIVGSYDNQRYSTINAERSINLFEYMDPQGKRPKTLLSTSGLDNADLNFGTETGGARAAFVFNNAVYQVFGANVYKTTGVTGSLMTVKINTTVLTNTAGYVGIDANQYQVIFVDGTLGYIYDTTPGNLAPWQQITDTGFPANPLDVCFLDGFFVVVAGGTNTFQLSAFNNGLVWSGGIGSGISFTASSSILTLSGSNANFATGVPVTFSTTGSVTFTADTTTSILTLSSSNQNFPTGTPLIFTTTSALPSPLMVSTTYYAIQVGVPTTNPGTIRVATTLANATAGTYITLSTIGSGTNTINASSALPPPLSSGPPQTYYVINIPSMDNNTIQVALTYADAIAGLALTLTGNGTPPNTITVAGQLQLGSITSHPGTIVGCDTLHRRLFLFSQNFTEVWENSGLGSNLPFRRNNSLLMEVGTPAVGSIQVGFDQMYFLAQDKDGLAGVMGVKGTESVLVSNRALDYQLGQYAETTGVSDARGILIKENGLIFYRLNFTASNHTFVLGVSMSTPEEPKWHEEEVLNFNRHPAQTHFYFQGTNYYGDYSQAVCYIVDDTVSTNNGQQIRRTRIGRQMTPEGYNRLRIDRFQVDLLQGSVQIAQIVPINLLTELSQPILTESGINIILEDSGTSDGGNFTNPQVYLSISKDGGQTYGYRLPANMGQIGQRTYRTVWRKLGTTPRGQGFVPKIEFFFPIPFIILGAAWDFEDMPE